MTDTPMSPKVRRIYRTFESRLRVTPKWGFIVAVAGSALAWAALLHWANSW